MATGVAKRAWPDSAPEADAGATPNAHAADAAALAAMRARVRGTQINEKTLLATDYLNHFNEINMILESLPDCPEMVEDARLWAPKSYPDHFEGTGFSYGPLAAAAYRVSPPEYREPLDLIVHQLDRLILGAVAQADRAIASGDAKELLAVRNLARKAQKWTARASGFIHGTGEALTQDEIEQGALPILTQEEIDRMLAMPGNPPMD